MSDETLPEPLAPIFDMTVNSLEAKASDVVITDLTECLINVDADGKFRVTVLGANFSFSAGHVDLANLAGFSADDLAEGLTHKYYTNQKVADLIQNSPSITWVYNDLAGTLTPTVTSIADGDKGDITVSSGVWTIDNSAVTFAKMQNISASTLLGNYAGGSSTVKEVTLSSNLKFTGSVLDTAQNIGTGSSPTFLNMVIDGDLTVNGTTTTIDTTNLQVADAFIKIARNNTTTSLDMGFYGQYDTPTTKYTGFFRDGGTATWYLFDGVTTEPTGGFSPVPANANLGTLQVYHFSADQISSSSFIGTTTANDFVANFTAQPSSGSWSTAVRIASTYAASPGESSVFAEGLVVVQPNITGGTSAQYLYGINIVNGDPTTTTTVSKCFGIHVEPQNSSIPARTTQYGAILIDSGAGPIWSNDPTPVRFSAFTTGIGHFNASGIMSSSLIVNADVSGTAGIVDTKLATIATAGKVSNSATTATSANTASAIVARDASGNFAAGTITASLTGASSLNVLKAGDTMTGKLTINASDISLEANSVRTVSTTSTVNSGTITFADTWAAGSSGASYGVYIYGASSLDAGVGAISVLNASRIEMAAVFDSENKVATISTVDVIGTAASGTSTNAYGMRVYRPTALSAATKTALYTQGISVGYSNVNTGVADALISGQTGIGTSSPAGKLHTVLGNVTTSSTLGAWDTTYAVFGQTGTTGGALGIGYNSTDGAVQLVSLTPGTAWRKIRHYAGDFEIYNSSSWTTPIYKVAVDEAYLTGQGSTWSYINSIGGTLAGLRLQKNSLTKWSIYDDSGDALQIANTLTPIITVSQAGDTTMTGTLTVPTVTSSTSLHIKTPVGTVYMNYATGTPTDFNNGTTIINPTGLQVNGKIGINTTPTYDLDHYNSSTATNVVAARFYTVANPTGVSTTSILNLKGGYGSYWKGGLEQGVSAMMEMGTYDGAYTRGLWLDGHGETCLGLLAGNALSNAAGAYRNTLVGNNIASSATSANRNVAMGSFCMNNLTTGLLNTSLGNEASYNITTGYANCNVGCFGQISATTAIYNTGMGYTNLYSNVSGGNNCAFGNETLYLTTGGGNCAFGSFSLRNNTTDYNSAFGYTSAYSNTSGSGITAIGFESCYANSTGTNMTGVGWGSLRNVKATSTAVGFASQYGISGMTNTAVYNTSVGASSMYYVHTGAQYNSAFGESALAGADGVTNQMRGSNNCALGFYSMYKNQTGNYNVGVGVSSLYGNLSGSSNTALGMNALYNANADENVAVGTNCMGSTTSGYQNSALGTSALFNNTTGYCNIAVGRNALLSNTTGYQNTVVGDKACYTATTAYCNTMMGSVAGYYTTTGSGNTLVGYGANNKLTTGTNNVALGTEAYWGNTTGSNNIAIGAQAGYVSYTTPMTGDNNIYIGYVCPRTTSSTSNEIVIGNGSHTNTTIYGPVTLPATILRGYDDHHSIYFRESGLDHTNYYSFGDVAASAGGHRFFTGGIRTSQTEKLRISNDRILPYIQMLSGPITSGTTNLILAKTGAYAAVLNESFLTMGFNQSTADYGHMTKYQFRVVRDVAVQNSCAFKMYAVSQTPYPSDTYSDTENASYVKCMEFDPVRLNTCLGYSCAVGMNTSASNNTYVGTECGPSGSSAGTYNTCMGYATGLGLTSGTYNTMIGPYTGRFLATGNHAIALGYTAMYSATYCADSISIGNSANYTNTDSRNIIAIGTNAGVLANGWSFIAIGNQAFASMTGGGVGNTYGNTALGHGAGYSNVAGLNMTLIGDAAGYYIKNINTAVGASCMRGKSGMDASAYYNTALGNNAMYYVNSGSTSNTALGHAALCGDNGGSGQSLTGIENVAVGYNSLYTNQSGNANVAVGCQALQGNVSGVCNTALGYRSMLTNTTGTYNTAVGFNALYTNSATSYNCAFGSSALYANTTGGTYNNAFGTSALQSNTSGGYNCAFGGNALLNITTGNHNVAIGDNALRTATTIGYSVAIGSQALYSNTSGTYNLAFGYTALNANTTGSYNVAIGTSALTGSTTTSKCVAIGHNALSYNGFNGDGNVAIGYTAMLSNQSGVDNVGIGNASLYAITTGSYNTAVGRFSLTSLTTGSENSGMSESAFSGCVTGSYNTGLGNAAGYNFTGSSNTCLGRRAGNPSLGTGQSGDNNIYIGASCSRTSSSTSNEIVIGNSSNATCRIYGIRGVTTTNADAIAVLVDSAGNLGTVSSSKRYKENIQPIEFSDVLYKLNPVKFNYISDVSKKETYGLIAEEVAEVFNDIVVYKDNQCETVQYHLLVPVMLKAMQEEHAKVFELKEQNSKLEEQSVKLLDTTKELKEQNSKLEAKVEEQSVKLLNTTKELEELRNELKAIKEYLKI